ncbi:U3 small nucleolar ribonucleoprotein protein MPP10 [Alosa sapidissima]|uniref:U3 small nucleolar ribonucleoprotein protein MPP10 n=1 Tax=Alosa sapidissima TaxID=34773 RepID=UPI001C086BB5|nr:U3 small nucleolar ribonucleoprotein protein MPP10 [Alosa sapidissima]
MMATGDTSNTLESCLSILNNKTAHPEQFLSLQDALAADFTALTKTLYDLHKAEQPAGFKSSPLDLLVVENFDEEQIWQELELQNAPALGQFEEAVSQVTVDTGLSLVAEEDEGAVEGDGIEDDDDDDEDLSDDEIDEGEEEEGDENDAEPGNEDGDGFSEEDSDVDFDVDALEKKAKQKMNQKGSAARLPKPMWTEPSEVDDKFFKLSEMEAFLDDMDRREGKDDQAGEDVDYFQDLPSGDEEEMTFDKPVASKRQKKKSSRNLKYKDYFDSMGEMPPQNTADDEDEEEPEEGGEDDEELDEEDMDEEEFDLEAEDINDEESRQARDALKRVTFDLPEESEGEDMEDIFGGKSKSSDSKSSFEKRQDKMAERISELENTALEEKPWQLTGEVTAQTRPENSLLEEDVAFDQASRMAPAITEETTMQLEEIIKQRIKDQVFDDVVRKEKPKENVFEYKKRLTLDHEKSKLSLAQVYEQEYVKLTQEKTEEEENPAHVQIQKMMDSLFLKLDALSNFHFTPKPAIPEVKVVSNLPSIAMEEVAPVSASDATLLAPEEVKEKNKAGDLIGDSEKTSTDKKRERRQKKKLKRLKVQEKEKRQKIKLAKTGENTKASKAQVADTLKKLTKGGKAKILTNDGMDKALRSSQAFFSQLQDQVKSQVKGSKEQGGKKKKNQKEVSASKLKL